MRTVAKAPYLVLFLMAFVPCAYAEDDASYNLDLAALPQGFRNLLSRIEAGDAKGAEALLAADPKIARYVGTDNCFPYAAPIRSGDRKMVEALLAAGVMPFYYDGNRRAFVSLYYFSAVDPSADRTLPIFDLLFDRYRDLFRQGYYREAKKAMLFLGNKAAAGPRTPVYAYDGEIFGTPRGPEFLEFAVAEKQIEFSRFVASKAKWSTSYYFVPGMDVVLSGGAAAVEFLAARNVDLNCMVYYDAENSNKWEGKSLIDFLANGPRDYSNEVLALIPLLKEKGVQTTAEIVAGQTTSMPAILLKGRVNDDGVRLRAAPNLEGEVLTKLNRNDAIEFYHAAEAEAEIGGVKGYWYLVKSVGGQRGWVWGKYVDFLAADFPEARVGIFGW